MTNTNVVNIPTYCACGNHPRPIKDETRQMMAIPTEQLHRMENHQVADIVHQFWYDVLEHQNIHKDAAFVLFDESCVIWRAYNAAVGVLLTKHAGAKIKKTATLSFFFEIYTRKDADDIWTIIEVGHVFGKSLDDAKRKLSAKFGQYEIIDIYEASLSPLYVTEGKHHITK